MASITQGQKLMLLVKDSQNLDEDIARAMGYGRTYLPKLYKMDILPKKVIQRAVVYFKVDDSYFNEGGSVDMVQEPNASYLAPSDREAQLKKENEILKEELETMRQRLVEQKRISEDLAARLEVELKAK